MIKLPDTPNTSTRDEAPDPDWYAPFLSALRTTPIVRTAAAAAHVGRTTVYDARQRDESFALRWAEAVAEGVETLEQVAFARGRDGQPVTRTVTKTDKDGNVETTVYEERHISDTVLLRVLSRYKPEYRDSARHELTGAGGGPLRHEVKVEGAADELFAELDRLAALVE